MRRISRREAIVGLAAAIAGSAAGILAHVNRQSASAFSFSVSLPFVRKGYVAATPTGSPTPTITATPTPTSTPTPTATATTVPTATTTPGNASPVYRIDNVPAISWAATDVLATHPGVEALLDLMTQDGLAFYRSSSGAPRSNAAGIIGNADIVVIKVNAQWPERGMTSTEVVRGLVRRIVDHPDGFVGEVVIADNGQGFGTHLADSSGNNDDSPNHEQSFQTVASLFSTHRVSTFDWSSLATQVQEWDRGDDLNGYVLAGPYPLNYPKFMTAYGTRISARRGIWNGSSYEAGKLNMINLPVLKAHGMFGMTGAVKNFVGFMSRVVGVNQVGDDDWSFHDNFTETFNGLAPGIAGSLMNLRYPDLNVLDATYVSPLGNDDGSTQYAQASHQASLLASLDPVAIDYYAAKYILLPLMVAAGQSLSLADPDRDTLCRRYLQAAQARMMDGGHKTRFGEGGYRVISYRLA